MKKFLLTAIGVVAFAAWALAQSTTVFVAPSNTGCSGGINIVLGTDVIQNAISANPAGTKFCLAGGTYYQSAPFKPLNGDTFVGAGEGVTFISGAKTITGPWTPYSFTQGGTTYNSFRASAFLPATPFGGGTCLRYACAQSEDIFLDNSWLQPVQFLSSLGAGQVFKDYTNNLVYVSSDPTGHLVEESYAHGLVDGNTNLVTNVTMQSMTLTKSANRAQTGVIEANSIGVSGWLIDTVEITFGHGAALELRGSTVQNCHLHNNGQEGPMMFGINPLINNCEVDHNNYAGFDPGWEAGTGKFVASTNGTFENSNVHDNVGPGIWFDIDNYNMTVTGNTVTNEFPYSGIIFEISSTGTINGNTVTNSSPNTGSAFYSGGSIFARETPHVTIYNNTVSTGISGSSPVDTGMAIGTLQQNRTDSCTHPDTGATTYPNGELICPTTPNPSGMHTSGDIQVHNNTITNYGPSIYSVNAGMSNDVGFWSYFQIGGTSPLTWTNNTYCNTDGSTSGVFYQWVVPPGQMNRGLWQSEGQDVGSVFHTMGSTC